MEDFIVVWIYLVKFACYDILYIFVKKLILNCGGKMGI